MGKSILYRWRTAILNFIFYLPLGGEAAFRDRCLEFAGLRKNEKILDVCCGTGKFAATVARNKLTVDVLGIDASLQAIRTAAVQQRNASSTFILASADSLPLETSHFDRCIVSFGLHHIPGSVRDRSLTDIYRILKPDGRLHIIDYNLPERGFGSLFAATLTKLDNHGEAYNMLRNGKLNDAIDRSGFKIEKRGLLYSGALQLITAGKNFKVQGKTAIKGQ